MSAYKRMQAKLYMFWAVFAFVWCLQYFCDLVCFGRVTLYLSVALVSWHLLVSPGALGVCLYICSICPPCSVSLHFCPHFTNIRMCRAGRAYIVGRF